MKTICEIARTGKVGDGKIFVSDLSDAIRVQTGEIGRRGDITAEIRGQETEVI